VPAQQHDTASNDFTGKVRARNILVNWQLTVYPVSTEYILFRCRYDNPNDVPSWYVIIYYGCYFKRDVPAQQHDTASTTSSV
jgi:hypothetical protein